MLTKIKHSLRSGDLKYFIPEVIIFLFALLTRFFRLDFPKSHMFDEVYHAFTAQEMFKGNPASWEWWNTPPAGFAYEWTHPPLAKEFMVLGISIFGDGSFAWRFFSALFGTGIIVLIYFISFHLFKNRRIALLSSFVASLDGLLLVMSRIAMNDSYFLFFSLLALLLFLKNQKLLMGIALGLATASKWSGVYVIAVILVFYLYNFLTSNSKVNILGLFKNAFFLFLIPFLIYVLSYIPFFLEKHIPPGTNYSNFQTFLGLQAQMYWYHTNLKATHPFQSKPQDWILNLKPVWVYTESKGNLLSNVYTLGNPLFMWGGIVAITLLLFEYLKKRSFNLFFVLFSYFFFFLPWIISPRIMFHYHYLPSVPFLAIAIGYALNKLVNIKQGKIFVFAFCFLLFALFIYFYPLWTGIHIPKNLYESYFWLKTWR